MSLHSKKIINEEVKRIKTLMGILSEDIFDFLKDIGFETEDEGEKEDDSEGKNDSSVIKTIQKMIDDNESLERQSKPIPYDSKVEVLQIALQFLGFSLPKWGVDGKFGPETEKAVQDFQEDNSMEITGIVTGVVLKKIMEELIEKGFKDEDLSDIEKDKTETIPDDGTTGSNIVIGDSQTPYVANGSSKFDLISTKGSESSLWLGGIGLSWLLKAVKKHPGSKSVKNIAICIGTNGGFNSKDDISGLVLELKDKFPNADLFAIQGSWGWGGVSNVKEDKVRKYYKRFQDQGVEVIEPPIGKIEPHGNKPIYKTIGKNLDEKIK